MLGSYLVARRLFRKTGALRQQRLEGFLERVIEALDE
jgi:hypothetical protein